jgi:sugar/nucleoside kinase (ribokinase family)
VLDIVCAGEGFDDFIFHSLEALPRPGQELKTRAFVRSPGGGAVITGIAAARLGCTVRVISALSDEAALAVRSNGVQVTNLRRAGEPSAVTVALSTRRDRRFITYVGVNEQMARRIRPVLDGVRARHVHLAFTPPRSLPWVHVVRRLRRNGATTSWDFGWSPSLVRDAGFLPLVNAVDCLFINRDEALLYSRKSTLRAAVAFWRRAAGCAVIKLGARGSVAVGRCLAVGELRADPLRVAALDTTGAGDAFNAGFLVARLHGRDFEAAMRTGHKVAASSVRRAGGTAGLPSRRRP